jgi:nucleotide-binding universal stress UspA family protein
MDRAPFAGILAPVDGESSSEVAVRRSQALLGFPGCRLTLLHVGAGKPGPGLERLAFEARTWGADVEIRIRAGAPASVILQEIREGRHDLVLMASRRRSRFAGALPGATSLRVLRQSPVPLLLYRPWRGLDESFRDVGRSEPARFRKILVMLDGSAGALRVVEPARRLARAFGSELVFFHAVPAEGFHPERVESARAYLARQADSDPDSGVPSRLQIVVGDPVTEALRALGGAADTLALATRTSSAWRAAAPGSTAASLLSRAEGPVLCVATHPEAGSTLDGEGRRATARLRAPERVPR